MIIVVDLVRGIFIVMFLVLMSLEIIVLITLTTLYNGPLQENRPNVEEISIKTTLEIHNSFNQILFRKYFSLQTDLLIIAKHLYPMYLTQEISIRQSTSSNLNYPRFTTDSEFYLSFNGCLIAGSTFTGSEIFKKYSNSIPQSKYPNFFFFEKLLSKNGNFTSLTEDQILTSLFNEDGMNYMMYYSEIPENTYLKHYSTYTCYALSVMKTLQIRNFIFDKNFLITKRFFLLLNDMVFMYPIDYLDYNILSKLPYYSSESKCKTKYSLSCLATFLNNTSYNFDNLSVFNSMFFEMPMIINGVLSSRGCIQIPFSNFYNAANFSSFACMEVSIDNVYREIKTANNSIISLSLIYPTPDDIQCFYTSKSGFVDDAENYFQSDYLKNYQIIARDFDKRYSLFHEQYYEIFKYYNQTGTKISEEEAWKYILQYKELVSFISEKVTSFKREIKECETYNTSYSRIFTRSALNNITTNAPTIIQGNISDDTFQYVLTPIFINHTGYYDSNYIYKPECTKKIAFYSLSTIRIGTKSIPAKIYFIFILKCIRSWFFFVSLLLFATIVYYIVCLFYVKILLTPIKDIRKNLDTLVRERHQQIADDFAINQEILTAKEKGNDILHNISPQNFFRNQETKGLERLLNFLRKIILMKQARGNTNYQVQSIIFKRFLNNLNDPEYKRQCEYIIAYSNYKDQNYDEAYRSLENLRQMIESEEAEILGKNETVEQKIINLPSQLKNEIDGVPYLNEFTDNSKFDSVKNKLIKLRILSQKMCYLFGLSKFLNFMHKKKELARHRISEGEKSEKLPESEYTMLDHAVEFLHKALTINTTMNFNQIKSIFILILISKCYYYMGDQIEAANHLKEALLKFSDLNKFLYAKNLNDAIDPRIMFVSNGLIMEQILFNLGKVCKKLGKLQLSGTVFNQLMEITYFRTDEIHRKACRKLNEFFITRGTKDNADVVLPKKFLLEKICKRLAMPPANKEICIIVSENLLKSLNSRYELREVMLKCIRNYVCENDLICYFQFDRAIQQVIEERTKWMNMKYFEDSKNLCRYSGKIFTANPKEKTDFFSAMKYAVQMICQNDRFYSNRDNDVCDKYIFAFLYSEDFRFNSDMDNRELSKSLVENTVSVYTFCFDQNITAKKKEKITKYLKVLVEGFLILVKNFKIIKQAFQNISTKGKQKNILQANYENHKFVI